MPRTGTVLLKSLFNGWVTCADCDSRFVNVGGDTMTGALRIPGGNKKFEITGSSGIFMYTNELNTKSGPLHLQHTSGGSGDAGTSVEVGHDLNVGGNINGGSIAASGNVTVGGDLVANWNEHGSCYWHYGDFKGNDYTAEYCNDGYFIAGLNTKDNGKVRAMNCCRL